MPRVMFQDHETYTEIAKAIRKHLSSIGIDVKHYYCLQMCARMFGYRNHQDYLSTVSNRASPPDLDATPDVLNARVAQYMSAIQKSGLTEAQAWTLITTVKKGPWLGIGRVMPKMPLVQPMGTSEES